MASTFRDLAGKTLDGSAEQVIESLLAVANSSGKVTRQTTCERCGHRDSIELQAVDAKTMLDVARFLSEQGFGRAGTATPPSNDPTAAVQKDLHALTDAELALAIHD
jgi:hypothetical protein